jgi:hypothetical protein
MHGSRTLNPTIARRAKKVTLNRVERERITDSQLKLQAVSTSLNRVDPSKVPDLENVKDCLEDADRILGNALRSPDSDEPE